MRPSRRDSSAKAQMAQEAASPTGSTSLDEVPHTWESIHAEAHALVKGAIFTIDAALS